jgi:DNA-binding CsgD family transcriptional regulator
VVGWAKPKWDAANRAEAPESVSSLRESTTLELRAPANRQALSPLETSAALIAALDAIGAPAFIVTANGQVLHASLSGRSLLESDSAGFTQAVFDVARGHASSRPISLTPLDPLAPITGQEWLFLAVLRLPNGDARVAGQVVAARTRWKLTARQVDVLDLAARGLTNATIAEMLGIGPSTVEFHLRSIFDKAGVDNRATLIARMLEL